MTATMKALRAHRRGGPEQLVYEDAPVPYPGPGEVLVAVHAAAITFAELSWDLSWTHSDGTDRTPVIPSHEVSGTVAAVGAGVTRPTVGEEVYGLVAFDRDGAAAEYVTVPAEALAGKPRSVPHALAAALPLAALTAFQALHEYAEIKPGETVLVHGGAGGVGVYGVQLAVIAGATVIATDVGTQAPFVRNLGAGRFVDVTREQFDDVVRDVDVVLDTVGGATLERSFAALRPGGRLVTLSAPPPAGLAERYGVRASFFVVRPDSAQLGELAYLVDAGRLRPIVSRTFPVSEGRQAYESGALPRPPGKTVLIVR
ncbi:NADP-dependent oxidoreductase [Hamadaea tsunoensis]|uniref:NADP-dependent oxidoreductase n=1 Tax=Hamadaea tsunoensis TaxID=53368 RepID=UPI0003F92F06|nr:NADP-dependent oxidoreductase [Hamadaea tsunoensis]